MHGSPIRPATDETLMTTPPRPPSIIAGRAYFEHRYAPRTWTANIRSQLASSVSMTEPEPSIPALLKRISSRKNVLRVARPIPSTLDPAVTSVSAQVARPPSALMDSATAAAAGPLISASITAAPSLANRRAVTSPMPEPPPVMIATFSVSRMIRPHLQQGHRPMPCSPSQGCGVGTLPGTTSAFLLPYVLTSSYWSSRHFTADELCPSCQGVQLVNCDIALEQDQATVRCEA